jgi:hypothetical protein
MEIVLSESLLADLRTILIPKLEKERSVSKDQIELNKRVLSLNETLQSIENKMGIREKLFGGFLGGNRELVKERDQIREKIQKESNIYDDNDKILIQLTSSITDEIKNFLHLNSPQFSELANAISSTNKLRKASKSYYNLLIKAKKGVADALAWASWETLINHPDAKKELKKFRKESENYQSILDKHEALISTHNIKIVNIIELIKFSSQKVAFDSFNKIIKHVKLIKSFSYKHGEALKMEEKELITSLKQRLET